MLKQIVSGFLSGLMICVGGSVYLACADKYVGSFLFSIALLTVCIFKLNLFTGKVGFLTFNHTKKDFADAIFGLIGNLLGCLVFGLIISVTFENLSQLSNTMCNIKLQQPLWKALVKGFFCGVIMYVAVASYKNSNTIVGILIGIPVFILSGFEHSIADMSYFFIARIFNLRMALFLILVVIGNSIGSVFFSLLHKFIQAEKDNKKVEQTEGAKNE